MLIVRTGAMGDVLHALPAVAALRQRNPDWEIGWAIEPRWRALLQAEDTGTMPLVDRIIPCLLEIGTGGRSPRGQSGSVLQLRRELRGQKYDLCVDMQGLLRSAVIGRFAGAAVFAGSARPREGAARRLYSLQVQTVAAHVVERGCELLGGALGDELRPVGVPLPVDAIADAWADSLSAETSRFALLAPTAGWAPKQWPVERYGALAAALASRGIAPLVNAARENEALAEAVRRASGGVARPVVCTVAGLAALLRRAAVMIAGDTGPLHLAAALGRPVVGLYGPTDPAGTGLTAPEAKRSGTRQATWTTGGTPSRSSGFRRLQWMR